MLRLAVSNLATAAADQTDICNACLELDLTLLHSGQGATQRTCEKEPTKRRPKAGFGYAIGFRIQDSIRACAKGMSK